MKNLRQLCMAVVLTLTLSAVALAGTIDCPGVTQEPPDETTSETQSATPSDSVMTEALMIMIQGVSLVS
jgi:hypothetical protein